MKAIILAAGRGERFQQITESNKCMLLLNGKPILERSLSYAKTINVEEIILVVGYKAESIINYYGLSFEDIPIKYIIQQKQTGIVDAIAICKKQLEHQDFILLLGDEIIRKPRHQSMHKHFRKNKGISILCGIVSVNNINRITNTYSILTMKHQIYRLIEKPTNITNNLMGTGNCFFRYSMLKYIPQVPINMRRGREEKELVDLIQCAIDDGNLVEWYSVGYMYENVNDESCILNILSNWEGDMS